MLLKKPSLSLSFLLQTGIKKKLKGRTGITSDELWPENELNLKTQFEPSALFSTKSYLAKPLKNFPIAMKSS